MADTAKTEDKEKILESSPGRSPNDQRDYKIGGAEKCMTVLIKVFSWFLIFLFFPVAIPMCVRTVQVVFCKYPFFSLEIQIKLLLL